MSEAPLRVDWLTFWILMATAVFLVWCVAAAVDTVRKHRTEARREGGLADKASVTEEQHRLGGVIDVFNKEAEEGEGPLPLLGWIALIGVPIWWLAYLIIYWNKH